MIRGSLIEKSLQQDLRAAYGERFAFHRIGPDITDTLTGERIEVATLEDIAAHQARGGAYCSASYVGYRWSPWIR